jgi:hypothetical protein
MHSSFPLSQRLFFQSFLFNSNLLSFISESLVSYTFIGCVGDSCLVNHICDHWLDLLSRLISSEWVHKLQFLIHISHLLYSLVIRGILLTPSSCSHFILESLNHLIKLVSCFDRNSISLIFLGIEHSNIIVASLILFTHLSSVIFCLILNTLVFSFKDSTYTLFRGFLRLIYVERHLRECRTRWKVARKAS